MGLFSWLFGTSTPEIDEGGKKHRRLASGGAEVPSVWGGDGGAQSTSPGHGGFDGGGHCDAGGGGFDGGGACH